jgi:hypothetical protein
MRLKQAYHRVPVTRLQPLMHTPEGLKAFCGRIEKLLISGYQRVQLLFDHAL